MHFSARRIQRIVLFVVFSTAFLAISGCGGGSAHSNSVAASPSATTNPGPTSTPTPTPTPTPGPIPSTHGPVVLVVEENHGYSSVIGSAAMPYLNSLAQQYGLATQYFANTHPSIGNYFEMTAGQIITNDDGFNGPLGDDNLIRRILQAGRTWKAYAESLPGVGYIGGDAGAYLHRHNPLSYFTDVTNSPAQRGNLVPFTQFPSDLNNGQLPDFSFVAPNASNDAHDCPAGTDACLRNADDWLQQNIGPLLSSSQFQQGGLLVIVFDEAEDADTSLGGGHIAMVVAGPRVKRGFQSSNQYQHQNLLKMIATYLGIDGNLGDAANASGMGEFFN
ncbi:MAG TPA: alkaline phosphatase family protein [Candidatus Angelobacter sp.]|nr:alkaline phosphatase family protein [Candidatus Angelobacter sp.]